MKNQYENFSENWIAFTLWSSNLFHKFGFEDGCIIPDFIEQILGIEDEEKNPKLDFNFDYQKYLIEEIANFSDEVPSLVNEILKTYKIKIKTVEHLDNRLLGLLIEKYLLPKINPTLEFERYMQHSPIRYFISFS